MSNNQDILFFTYADEKYDFFAIPYAYFALRNNPNSKVEIILANYDKFAKNNAEALDRINHLYPKRTVFRQSELIKKNKKIVPNTVSFIEKPITVSKYLYIGDIDLLILDDVMNIHLRLIEENNIRFSNMIRANTVNTPKPRLTGLHFVLYEDYFPLADLSDLDLTVENDEYVLYENMKRKGYMVPASFQIRPECGIHMSLNRDPEGRTTSAFHDTYDSHSNHKWGGAFYHSRFLEQIKEENFGKLIFLLDFQFRFLLLTLEALATDKLRMLHRFTAAYVLDKRLALNVNHLDRSTFNSLRDKALKENNFDYALQLDSDAMLIWPFSLEVWFKMAWLYMAVGKVTECIETLFHLYDLPQGAVYLEKSRFVQVNREKLESFSSRGKRIVQLVSGNK